MNADLQTFVYASDQATQPQFLPVYAPPEIRATPSPVYTYSSSDSLGHQPRHAGTDYDSSTITRRTYRAAGGTGSNRNSIYASGTQSAYTSREASPEKGWRLPSSSSTSPYPRAPPSMIISPSHTPRRAMSVEPESSSFSNREMAKLYQKLNAIEQDSTGGQALVKERGYGHRVLLKSMSVDASEDSLSSEKGSRSKVYQQMNSQYDPDVPPEYDDAPKSETLLASIRIGKLVITPGLEKLTRKYTAEKRKEKRAVSLSPKSARKKFYDNYPYESKARDGWNDRLRGGESDSEVSDAENRRSKRGVVARHQSLDADLDTAADADKLKPKEDKETSKDRSRSPLKKSAAAFIQSVKDKRKLFQRRAQSQEPDVRRSLADMGVKAAKPAAPSSFVSSTPNSASPSVSEAATTATATKEPDSSTKKSSTSKKKKLGSHGRSVSIDATSLFSSSSSRQQSNSSSSGSKGTSSPVSASTSTPSHSSSIGFLWPPKTRDKSSTSSLLGTSSSTTSSSSSKAKRSSSSSGTKSDASSKTKQQGLPSKASSSSHIWIKSKSDDGKHKSMPVSLGVPFPY